MQNLEKYPPQNEIIEAMISILKQHPKGMHIRDIETGVANHLLLSAELTTRVQKGKRKILGYKLAWARTKCKKDGLIVSAGPSVWRLADR